MTYLAETVRKIPGAKIACYVPALNADYVLNHRFSHRDDPKLFSTLDKIREAGKININNWHIARKGEI